MLMDCSTNEIKKESPVIKHIVCSGGGIAGLQYFGILQESCKQGLWCIEDIQTYYATSAGTLLGIFLLLRYDWKEVEVYLVKRPWYKLFPFGIKSIIGSISQKGMFSQDSIKKLVMPFLLAKDLSEDITMKEFYELTKIEFHCFTTNVHTYQCVDISYKTHPDWKLIDVVYSSCAMPIVFEPLLIDNQYYADGCLISNFPLAQCINNGALPEEILGISCTGEKTNKDSLENDTLLDYLGLLIGKMAEKSLIKSNDEIAYYFEVAFSHSYPYLLYEAVKQEEEKQKFIQKGENIVSNYMSSPNTNE